MEKGQMKRGLLEFCVLHIVSNGEFYGYEIMKRVKNAFPEINESTIYAVLRRLHSDDLTESYMGNVSGGPQRKYYRITENGKNELVKMRNEWNEILAAMAELGVKNES